VVKSSKGTGNGEDASSREGTFTNTQVDLGEDLLEKTRTRTQTRTIPGNLPAGKHVGDDLQSAKILLGEGLVDDAKRVLRRILINDPGNAPAKAMLNEILDRELKQLFGEGGPQRRRFSIQPPPELDLSQIDPEGLMRGLDRDLDLGLFEPGDGPVEELRQTSADLGKAVDAQLKGATPRDRIDIGVGFFELGMPELALKQFQAAHRQCDPDDPGTLFFSASCLLAETQILCEKSHDAVEVIQVALRSPAASFEEKLELIYLMGKANERLKSMGAAHSWYRLVSEIDPTYRDVQDRLARTQPSDGNA
jgi:hypothetical protein